MHEQTKEMCNEQKLLSKMTIQEDSSIKLNKMLITSNDILRA